MILLTVVLATRQGIRLDRPGWSMIGLLGLLGVFGYNVLFFAALTLAPASDGSMIVPVLSPVITTVLTALIGRERLPRRRGVGLALAAAGAVVFFVGTPVEAAAPHRILGDVVFVAAAMTWSAYTICGRRRCSVWDWRSCCSARP